ncbi:hypothetical protein, partial [Escherichia coli]|uniref:hypothetical protein n=2 Tax=Escherichia coli TaxID=562 RepID=UPI001BDB9B17
HVIPLTDYKASKVGKTFLVLKKSTLKVGFFCIFILFTTQHFTCQIKQPNFIKNKKDQTNLNIFRQKTHLTYDLMDFYLIFTV